MICCLTGKIFIFFFFLTKNKHNLNNLSGLMHSQHVKFTAACWINAEPTKEIVKRYNWGSIAKKKNKKKKNYDNKL